MPAMTMRGRYLMREYWTDSDLFLRLTADERELYQGLWMLADDAGWMPWDVPAIAAAVYQYEDRSPREAKVRATVSKLVKIGKVERHKCCLFLPAVVRYPRSGKKSVEHKAEHQTHSNRFDGRRGQTPAAFETIQTDTNGYEPLSRPVPSLPDVAGARDPDGAAPASEFQQLVPRPIALGKR